MRGEIKFFENLFPSRVYFLREFIDSQLVEPRSRAKEDAKVGREILQEPSAVGGEGERRDQILREFISFESLFSSRVY